MKLSIRDIKILECFASINPSIQFKKGQIQKTVSPTKSILAKAAMDIDFDRDFAIYDLSRFLRVVNLAGKDESEISLFDQFALIQTGSMTTKYYYCAPETIFSINDLKTQDDLVLPNQIMQFVLTSDIYTKLIKAVGVIGVNAIAFVTENGCLYAETHDTERRVHDGVRFKISEDAGSDRKFVFSIDNLKLIAGDYAVTISNGFSSFEGLVGSPTHGLTYWIAMVNK